MYPDPCRLRPRFELPGSAGAGLRHLPSRKRLALSLGGLHVLRACFVSALCWACGFNRAWGRQGIPLRQFVSSEKKSTINILINKYDHIMWWHVPGRKQLNELELCYYTSVPCRPAASKHQGAHQKGRVSGPAQDLLNLHFKEILRGCLWSRGQEFIPSMVITPGEKKYSLTYWDLNILSFWKLCLAGRGNNQYYQSENNVLKATSGTSLVVW